MKFIVCKHHTLSTCIPGAYECH